jgi:Zn-dependent protease
MEPTAVVARVAIVAVPLLVAVVLHEVAHGVVAYGCGDPTAARAGRLTLNPLPHVDPVGTVLLPGVLLVTSLAFGSHPMFFGWAKPVPIDGRWFRRPRLDWLLVALAGPGTNLVLALASAIALGWLAGRGGPDGTHGFLWSLVGQSVVINCLLAVFNLLPVPPLDGGRVLAALLPPAMAQQLRQVERVGLLIVLLVVFNTGILQTLVRPVTDFYIGVARQVALRVAG